MVRSNKALYISVMAKTDTLGASAARLAGIDIVRFFAFVGVVFIHCAEISVFGDWAADFGKFAVPFFFVAAGFFLPTAKPALSIIWKSGKRLAIPFLFWMTLFIVIFQDWPSGLAGFIKLFIAGGPAYHLWFLPSLALCIAATVFLRYLSWPVAFAISLACYVIGLAIGSYGDLQGPVQGVWNPRNGILFGLIFVVLGGWIRASGARLSLGWALLAFVGFSAAHMLEISLPFHRDNVYGDFYILTVPVGVSAFFVALALKPSPLVTRIFAPLGAFSLGLYGVHLIFVRLLVEAFSPAGFLPWLGVVTAVVLLSIAVVWPLSRIKYLRSVVS